MRLLDWSYSAKYFFFWFIDALSNGDAKGIFFEGPKEFVIMYIFATLLFLCFGCVFLGTIPHDTLVYKKKNVER